MPATRLGLLRREIDRLNAEILDRVQRRAEVVLEIADLKREQGLHQRDPGREEQMLLRLTRTPAGPFDEAEIRIIFQAVFQASLALMERYDQAESAGCTASGEPKTAVLAVPTKDRAHAG